MEPSMSDGGFSSLKNRLSKVVQDANAKKRDDAGEIDLDLDDFEKQADNPEWETSARGTLVKMFKQAALEENFTFKVAPGTADHYVNAMRGVLARVRKKAEREKRGVDEFKMLVVEVKQEPTHDAVTLVRTKTKSRVAKSAYDDLLGFVAAESEKK